MYNEKSFLNPALDIGVLCYKDTNNLMILMSSICNNYRILAGAATEINQITLARKSQVKQTYHLISQFGDVLDNLLDVIGPSLCPYEQYLCNKYVFIDALLDDDVISPAELIILKQMVRNLQNCNRC